MTKSLAVLLGATLCLTSLAGCKKQPPPNVAATVNGRPITFAEVEKLLQSQFSGETANRPNDDQLTSLKLEVVVRLIEKEIMYQRAEKQSLIAADSEVDAKINELKAPYTQEGFARVLQERKLTLEDLRTQIRRDLSIQKLINKEITSRISISDKDIAEFYAANKQSFNLPEPRLHIAQIVVTPTPDPNVRNLRSNKAQNEGEARKKIEMIEMRLRQGEDFGVVAQNFSEDPTTAPNGGDLGFIPESALERVHPELRRAVLAVQPGQMTKAIALPDGFRILKVMSREPAGQRELNDPSVQQTIRDTLMSRRDQLLKDAYIEVARNEAEVENFFAKQVVESQSAAK